ncbi:MAG: hypothetical protein ACR2PY_08050, partial [Salinispira sp.]
LLLYMKALKLDTRFEKINREINPEGERVMMKKVQMSDWFVNQGLEKGILKGRVEGLALGMERGIEKTARNMIRLGIEESDVVAATKLSPERVRELRGRELNGSAASTGQ